MTDFKVAFIDFSDDLLDGVISDLTKENEEYKAFKDNERKAANKYSVFIPSYLEKFTA